MNSPGVIRKEIQRAADFGLFDDPEGQVLVELFENSQLDPDTTWLINQRIMPLKKLDNLGQLPPFTPPRLSQRGIPTGADQRHRPVFLPPDLLNRGMAFVSGTGGGKSNWLNALFPELASAGYTTWGAELSKKQLRRLLRTFGQLGVPLTVLRTRDWRVNLLQFASPERVADVLVRAMNLPPGAASIFKQAIFTLKRQQLHPNLYDVYGWIKDHKELNFASREAILDKLRSFLLSLGAAGAYRDGWKPADFTSHNVIFEMTGASESVKQVLLELLLFAVFEAKVDEGLVNCPLQLFIAFEDSQRFFNSSPVGDLSSMEEMAGICRGVGIGLCVLVQSMEGLSKSLLANLCTRIMGQLSLHADCVALGRDMGLSSEQIEFAKLNLKPGLFIMQLAEGGWRRPFLLRVPKVNLGAHVSDDEVVASQDPFRQLPVEAAPEHMNWDPFSAAIELHTDAPEESAANDLNLSDRELRALRMVVGTPLKSVSWYCRQLKISGREFKAIRERLESLGLLRFHPVQASASGKGRPAMVLEPTAEGEEAAK